MPNLTPLEVQKQSFDRSFRGYAVDDVRAYLHVIAEELEDLLHEVEVLRRENQVMREEIAENSERERILKETLMSAQRVSEELRVNASKEAELIVKDAELLSERMVGQAMERVGDLEQTIQDLKLERRTLRNKLQLTIDTFQQMIALDAEHEANELPITHLHRKLNADRKA